MTALSDPTRRSDPATDAIAIGPEVRWTAAMLWLIGVVPSAGLGILLLGGRTSTLFAGLVGVLGFTLVAFPIARATVVHTLRQRTLRPLPPEPDR